MIAEAFENNEPDYEPRHMPLAPTIARPGSIEKIEVLRARVSRGEYLHHQDDARFPLATSDWFADRQAHKATLSATPAQKTEPNVRSECAAVAVSAAAAESAIEQLAQDDLLQAAMKVSEDREVAIQKIDAKLDELRGLMARLQLARRVLAGSKRRIKTR